MRPHSKHVSEFFAALHLKKKGLLWSSLGTLDDPTAYIGKSVHIGNRVAQR